MADGKGKEKAKKVFQVFKKFSPAMVIARNAFLSLVALNVFSLANRLKKTKDLSGSNSKVKDAWNKILDKYYRFGGSKDVFIQRIEAGAKRKPRLVKLQRNGKSSFDGVQREGELQWMTPSQYHSYIDGERHQLPSNVFKYYNMAGTASVLATITAALPLLITIINMLKPVQKEVGALDLDGETTDALDEKAATDPDVKKVIEEEKSLTPEQIQAQKEEAEKEEKEAKNKKMLMYGGLALVGIGLTVFLIKMFKSKE